MAIMVLFVAICLSLIAACAFFILVRIYNARHNQFDDQLAQRMIDLSGFVKVNSL